MPHKIVTPKAGGVVLHISPSHSFLLSMGLGLDTNNYAELMVLKVLLLFAKEKDVKTLQIFGDSKLIINWTKKIQSCHNLLLLPLLEDVLSIFSTFDSTSMQHV